MEIGELHDAVKIGNLKKVGALLKRGADVNAMNMNGVTPLHVAAGLGQYSPGRKGFAPPHSTDVAKLLIKHGADVNVCGSTSSVGRTALHGFAENGDTKVASLLIERGADVNAQDMDGRAPLHLAARWGNTEIAKLLIKHGANVNVRVMDGSTPLRIATLNSHEKLVELLQQHGGIK